MGIKTKAEHIDTNIILRIIIQDDEVSCQKVKRLMSKKKQFILEDVVVMEAVFVLLGNTYRFTRAEVAEGIRYIMGLENVICNKQIIEEALEIFTTHPKLSFTDCYLAILTETSGETPLWTLDKKLARQCSVARELK